MIALRTLLQLWIGSSGITLPWQGPAGLSIHSPTCAAAVEGQQRLKEQRAAIEEMAESLRSQLATAELRLRKAGLDAQDTAQQMAYLQEQLQVGWLHGRPLRCSCHSWGERSARH